MTDKTPCYDEVDELILASIEQEYVRWNSNIEEEFESQ